MVGPSGSGKSTAWKVLLKALERYEGTEGVAHVIDPKAISKEALYGVLDPNTREWTDGLFTHILRLELSLLGNYLLEINRFRLEKSLTTFAVRSTNANGSSLTVTSTPNGLRISTRCWMTTSC